MTLSGEYAPSPAQWVRDQVERYERTGGREANTLRDTGIPIVVVTTRGVKSGKLRKNPVMRVSRRRAYAVVASKGGADEQPQWYYNLEADPDAVTLQDGPEPWDGHARELSGDERQRVVGPWRRDLSVVRGIPDPYRPVDPGVPGRAPLTG